MNRDIYKVCHFCACCKANVNENQCIVRIWLKIALPGCKKIILFTGN